jgi:DNA repair exonuclease SbcCD ATPase subunit
MLTDLIYNANAIYDSIEEIREQARSEGFSDYETNLLLKTYLERGLGRDKARYILHEKGRRERERQKSLTDKLATGCQDNYNNVPEIPAPDYKIVLPDAVIEQEQEQLQQEEYKPDYALEDLRSQIENYKTQLEESTTRYKDLEEKYKQLEARTRVSPSNYIPAVQGNTLRTKVVVAQIFREVLVLKGSKMIYANIAIDLTQNKYIRLEPV